MAKISSTNRAKPQIKPSDLLTFHRRLARWYKTHGRHDLPWRNTDDAYAIWISEVMLQQTQVSTVLERYYFPFLKCFPSVQHLARASRQEVLKAWEGLGYYRRAGYLHEAAKKIIAEGGLAPPSRFALTPAARDSASPTQELFEAWRLLPGIGKNTANAILAFAYHQPVAVLEANVKRVVARIYALKTPKDVELWHAAEQLLNRKTPFDYNQAMMDVGSLICTPKAPRCGDCPATTLCKGKTNPSAYPAPKAKKSVPTRHVMIRVMQEATGKLYLHAREDALLGGLYGFPQSALVQTEDDTRIGYVTHSYSHFKLIGSVHHICVAQKKNSTDWYTRAEIGKLPLSRLDHKVLALLTKQRRTG